MKILAKNLLCALYLLLACSSLLAQVSTPAAKPVASGAVHPASSEHRETTPATNPIAIMHTSMGDIRLELYRDKSPLSVENFINYANSGFYNGTIFHRVISHFMIQGGGFTEKMEQKTTGEPIQNEAANGLSNKRGTVAMARTNDPHSATAQFFINTQDNFNLDYTRGDSSRGWGYAVFGKVTEGMEVVDAIRFVATASVPPYTDVPVVPVVISGVEIVLPEQD